MDIHSIINLKYHAKYYRIDFTRCLSKIKISTKNNKLFIIMHTDIDLYDKTTQ